MFEKKERPKFMGINFDEIEVNDYFSIETCDLGENGLSYLLEKAREIGVVLSYKKNADIIEFWCDNVDKKNDDILKFLTKETGSSIDEISFKSKLSKPSVKEKLMFFIKREIVDVYEVGSGKRGRPNKFYRLK